MSKEANHTLLALTSAALLLPAFAPVVKADAPPDKTSIDYQFTRYSEEDVKPENLLGGSAKRYDIDIHQFRLVTPVADDFSLELAMQADKMSGASPWYTVQTASGQNKLVMSGASIKDNRRDIASTLRYHFPLGNVAISLGNSSEDDYRSNTIGLAGSHDFNQKNTTLSGGISYADDRLKPTQGKVPTGVKKADKDTRSLFFGISQVINQNTLVQAGLAYTHRQGYLTDPYKLNDARPDQRNEWAWTLGGRIYFAEPDAALQLDYRYFRDNWGLDSHTLEIAWHQPIGSSFQLVPSIRYYSQRGADFFNNRINPVEVYHSSDFRLSGYGSISYGLKLIKPYKDWEFTLAALSYSSSAAMALHQVKKSSPGLVDFTTLSFSIHHAFD